MRHSVTPRTADWSLAQKLTVGFLLVASLAISSELLARLDDYFRHGISMSAAPSYADLVIHDAAGAHGTPNGRYGDIRLNSAGFRSSESALVHKPGCIRVMTLGSSETFGTGTTPGNEYPAQLQDSLGAHGCFQVLNAAMVGMGLRATIQYWNTWAGRFRPDIVVILTSPTVYLGNSTPAFPVQGGANQQPTESHVTSRLLERTHEFIHYPDFIQRRRVQNMLDELTRGRPEEWYFSTVPEDRLELYTKDLDSLLTVVRATGATPVLATYPIVFGDRLAPGDSSLMAAWREYSPRARPAVMLSFMAAANDMIRTVGSQRAAPVVDLSARLNGHPELFADVVHYSNKGAHIVAGLVSHVIVRVSADQRSLPR